MTGPATFSATLEWGAAITTSPGRGSFVLPVPPAGSATATFDVPGEQSDVPCLARARRCAARPRPDARRSRRRSIRARRRRCGGRHERRRPTATPRDARLLADVKSLVTIGDADVRLRLARRPHDRPGRAVADRRRASGRLRARRRRRAFARAHRAAGRSRHPRS